MVLRLNGGKFGAFGGRRRGSSDLREVYALLRFRRGELEDALSPFEDFVRGLTEAGADTARWSDDDHLVATVAKD